MESLRLVAATYLAFWHFGIQKAFISSIWWHFLNPANLAIDMVGVGMLFGATAIAPALLEIPCVFRLFLRHWWVFYGIVPVLLVPFTAVPHTRVRTAILAFSSAGGYVGALFACCIPSTAPLARCFPWAAVLGALLMQIIKLAWASVNPFMDRHYTDPNEFGFLGLRLTGCIFAALAAIYLWKTTSVETQRAVDEEVDMQVADGGSNRCIMCFVSDRRGWMWLALGPIFAYCMMINHAYLGNPGAVPKLVGINTWPAAVLVPLCFACGMPFAYFLSRHGAALPISAFVLILSGAMFSVGTVSCTGPGQCEGFASIGGGLILVFAQPTLVLVLFMQMSRISPPQPSGCTLAGAAGRTFAFGGFLLFLQIYLKIAMLFNNIQGIAGLYGVWMMVFVVIPALLGLVVIIFLHWRDNGAEVFARTEVGKAMDAPADANKVGTSPKAMLLVCSFMVLVPLVVASLWRTSRSPITTAPFGNNSTVIKVMAFNNMQGYTTEGYWNGECFSRIIRDSAPDHVGIPEGEAMRMHTGSRDPVDFAAADLRMFVDFGPPSWGGGAGIAVLSSREFITESWEMLPKEPDKLNRFFIRSVYNVGNVRVHVLSIHAEWFGDPTVQVSHIAKRAAQLDGPVIVLGDFNLEPNGANNNAKTAKGLASMTDAGFKSVTPLTCKGAVAPDGHLCRSTFPNVVVDTDCQGLAACDGYQLDYIFYTPRWLTPVNGSVKVVDGKIDGDEYCSDHEALEAVLALTQEALSNDALKVKK